MTVPGQIKQPLRCVVSRSAQLDLSLPIFSTPGGQIHWLATDEESNRVENSMKGGVIVHHGSLEKFLGCLANEYHIKRIHCEGGGQLIRSLAELNWIDEYHLTIAGHTLFGGFQAATATGIPGDFLKNSLQFEISEFLPNPVNGECFLTYHKIAKS